MALKILTGLHLRHGIAAAKAELSALQELRTAILAMAFRIMLNHWIGYLITTADTEFTVLRNLFSTMITVPSGIGIHCASQSCAAEAAEFAASRNLLTTLTAEHACFLSGYRIHILLHILNRLWLLCCCVCCQCI